MNISFTEISEIELLQVVDVSELWAQQVEITNFDLADDRVKNSTGRSKDMTKLRERTNVQAATGEKIVSFENGKVL